jgi:hypothetical protein
MSGELHDSRIMTVTASCRWKRSCARECFTRMRHQEPREPAEVERRQQRAGHVRDRLLGLLDPSAAQGGKEHGEDDE